MKFSMSISIRDGVGATNYCHHHAYRVVSYMLTETKQMLESESQKKNLKNYKWKNVSSPMGEGGSISQDCKLRLWVNHHPPTHIGTMVKISQNSFKLFQEMWLELAP